MAPLQVGGTHAAQGNTGPYSRGKDWCKLQQAAAPVAMPSCEGLCSGATANALHCGEAKRCAWNPLMAPIGQSLWMHANVARSEWASSSVGRNPRPFLQWSLDVAANASFDSENGRRPRWQMCTPWRARRSRPLRSRSVDEGLAEEFEVGPIVVVRLDCVLRRGHCIEARCRWCVVRSCLVATPSTLHVSVRTRPWRRVRGGRRLLATWLILPVVICLSQRLSHACASINA